MLEIVDCIVVMKGVAEMTDDVDSSEMDKK